MAFALESVRRVRLMSLVGDFATCIERSEGPITRRGNLSVVIPSHCSGLTFEAALERTLPRGFIMDSVGSDDVFER
jgi:hypothetical protein